ncbi:MAG: hypothetical protein ACPGWR_13680 [Ardenticatenaceae bacterium]
MAVADILMSGAKVYYAPVGESIPDETTVAYDASWGGNWVDLGYTLSPLQVSYNRSLFSLDVQQRAGKIKSWVVDESVIANTTLAEMTGANLALALNGSNTSTAAGASQKGYHDILFGGKRSITHYAAGFEGYREDSAGDLQPIRLFFFKATIVASGSIPLDKSSPTGIPITFESLVDPTATEGEGIGRWQVVHSPATA